MKLFIKRHFIVLLLTCICSIGSAQDFINTQLFNNKLFLNPAFTGLNWGQLTSVLSTRTQFTPNSGKFELLTFSLDQGLCKFKNVGLGFLAKKQTLGDGKLQTTTAGISFCYNIQNVLFFSLQYDYINQSLDWSKLTFSDQYDPIYGINGTSINSNLSTNSRNNQDFSFGFLNRFPIKKGELNVFHYGFSVFHLFEPDLGIIGENKIPRRYQIHAGMIYHLKTKNEKLKLNLVPYARLSLQNFKVVKSNLLDLGANIHSENFYGGLGLRTNIAQNQLSNTNAFLINIGSVIPVKNEIESNLRITYSLDFNFTGISTNNIHTHEISLIYQINRCSSDKKMSPCDYKKLGIQAVF
jgi:type IX secretion system PorP/SprF family membrane protein